MHQTDVSPEDKIAALEAQLLQSQKLTALGELVSTITHEYNNVLTTIINYAKLGLRHKDAPTRDKALDKILTAGHRAAKLTNGILAFARNRTGGFEPTDLTRVIDDSILLLERELSKYRVRIECQIQPTEAAWANGNQIQQVLLNLLINARQAMPGGGVVMIRLAQEAPGELIELSVRDTGCGIPADKLPKIFDRFFTTKTGPDASGKGGTGLGLAMCRDIIEAHHGRIRVESTVGRGTSFTLKLPPAPATTPVSSGELSVAR
jgi:signal transduction histidine kinase